MLKLLLLLTVNGLAVLGCGVPIYPPFSRLVNGVEAHPNSWPWQVSVQGSTGVGFGYSHMCGGTLIASNWVLTAAHCILPGYIYQIVAGEHNLNQNEGGEQVSTVSKIIAHENWKPNCISCGYDVALFKLSNSISLNDKVQFGCLPEASLILPHNYPCYISGWGLLNIADLPSSEATQAMTVAFLQGTGAKFDLDKTSGFTHSTLQQALLPVTDYQTCSQSSWWGTTVKNTMICGGDGIKAGCNGDSGGPLQCKGDDDRWYVHGIASFVSGYGCSTYKKPTVFTRVSAYTDWIYATMAKN